MTPAIFRAVALAPAFVLLPPAMDTPAARAFLTAIALQESELQHRHQVGGPARSYLQFERSGGVTGVLRHPASRAHAIALCRALDITPTVTGVWHAFAWSDVLAVGFGRLLLLTLPAALPTRDDVDGAFDQYLDAWRPGAWTRGTAVQRAALRQKWTPHFAAGWQLEQAA